MVLKGTVGKKQPILHFWPHTHTPLLKLLPCGYLFACNLTPGKRGWLSQGTGDGGC